MHNFRAVISNSPGAGGSAPSLPGASGHSSRERLLRCRPTPCTSLTTPACLHRPCPPACDLIAPAGSQGRSRIIHSLSTSDATVSRPNWLAKVGRLLDRPSWASVFSVQTPRRQHTYLHVAHDARSARARESTEYNTVVHRCVYIIQYTWMAHKLKI